MAEGKHTVLILMAGPKFDLEWEFGARLEGISKCSRGYLLTSSFTPASLRLGDYDVVATASNPGSPGNWLFSRCAYFFRCVSTMRRARRSGRPVELVVTYDPLVTGAIGWLLASLYRARLICEVNGEYTADANFMHIRSPWMKAIKTWSVGVLTRFVLKRAAGIRTLFPSQLEDLGYRPRLDQVVVQSPEFVNTEAFRDLGEEPTVLLVGFPFFVKGVDIAIAAFKRVTDDFPGWKLKIVGYYPDVAELERAVGECGTISYDKPVPHRRMNEYVGRCGIVFQPSRTEAMGRVLVEAMAASKPRIASRVGGIPTVVSDGHDGLLVDSEDVEGFARALATLMGSAETRRRMGNAGFQRIASEFTTQKYVENIGRLFGEVNRIGIS